MGKTAYIGGPMQGIAEFNYPAFFEAEKRLLAGREFDKVINPAAMGDDGVPPYEEFDKTAWRNYLIRDLKAIMDAGVDTLVLLPGWRKSDGARLEARVCRDLMGAKLYEYGEDGDGYKLEPTWVGIDKL